MLYKILLEAWEGDTRLWKVYWIYGVLAGVFLQFLYIAVAGTNAVLVGAVILMHLVWLIWLSVSLWQCSDNCEWRGWSLIVKGLVVVSLAYAVQAVVMLAL